MLQTLKIDKLEVLVFENRAALGLNAAQMAGEKIKELLVVKPVINIVFAAAPSQNEFLAALAADDTIEWNRINAFHMDEYLGLPESAPELFSSFLKTNIFDKVSFASVNCINGSDPDFNTECSRYTQLLKNNPVDIVCMGIGENTHIAFNDPHVANFKDPELVKVVQLDEPCRRQQVNDACFATLNDVPQYALTLTVPALIAADYIFCMVPGINKATAIQHTLNDAVSELYPSTILKTHNNAVLFVDTDSFSKVA
jgi:glucosamine-6-phosphate deaminase